MPRPRVFLDMQIGTQPAGRITIELFDDKTPKTCENFRLLCTGAKGSFTTPTATHSLHYKNSTFHRIISEFMIQGGDITNGDGTGGISVYDGKMFADENLGWRGIDKEGLVCMANRGKSTNSSQFFITLAECDYLTQKHTLFGHVVAGMDVVKKIEDLKVDDSDRPLEDVIIAGCGELIFRKKESTPAPTTLEVRRKPHSRSRERKKDDTKEDSRRHRRKRSRDGNGRPKSNRSRSRGPTDSRETRDGVKGLKAPVIEDIDRGRSRERRGPGQADATIMEEPEDPLSSPQQPKRIPSRSRSRSRHRHRRRRYHSGSRSPSRRRHRRHRDKAYDYTRDEEAEERIRREENEREMGRFARMDEDREKGGGGEPEVKFKGRGSMKYREKKSWGYGGGEGRLV